MERWQPKLKGFLGDGYIEYPKGWHELDPVNRIDYAMDWIESLQDEYEKAYKQCYPNLSKHEAT
jgi:hypothetical protein